MALSVSEVLLSIVMFDAVVRVSLACKAVVDTDVLSYATVVFCCVSAKGVVVMLFGDTVIAVTSSCVVLLLVVVVALYAVV